MSKKKINKGNEVVGKKNAWSKPLESHPLNQTIFLEQPSFDFDKNNSDLVEEKNNFGELFTPDNSKPASKVYVKKSLQELTESGSFEEVQLKLFQVNIDVLAQVGINCLRLFLDKFKDYDQRELFVNILISKIDIAKNSQSTHDLIVLKAACLKAKGEDILNNVRESESKDIKFLRHQNALEFLEKDCKLYEDLLKSAVSNEDRTYYNNEISSVRNLINSMIMNYGDVEEAFRLAELSFQQRKINFDISHQHTLEALIVLGELGAKSKVFDTKIKGLNHAENAYNVACSDRITSLYADEISKILTYMSEIYLVIGDKEKAIELGKESAFIKQLSKSHPNEVNIEERSLIIKKGITDQQTIAIKQLLQEQVLNPIQKVSAEGKWHKSWPILYSADYGVSGYLEESFLTKILGTACNKATIKISLGLCFEAINIGIMSSKDKNPLVSAIFCQKYPDIIKELIQTHPEYFIDGFIIKAGLANSANFSNELLGTMIPENDSYNKFFETSILPFITKRVEDTVLSPIKQLIEKGDWSAGHNSKLKGYLSEDYLINSVLGNNFSKIEDTKSIVRVLAFKTICEAISTSKSVNYAAIHAFFTDYPELSSRVIDDHKEYFCNNGILLQLSTHARRAYESNADLSTVDLAASIVMNPEKLNYTHNELSAALVGDVSNDDV